MIDLKKSAWYDLPSVFFQKKDEKKHADVKEILYTSAEIKSKVEDLAKRIQQDYRGKTPLLICVMRWAAVFCHDMMIALWDIEYELDTVRLKSYEWSESSGKLSLLKKTSTNLEGRDIIIIEDIVDTWHTLSAYKKILASHHPHSISICSLLHKWSKRKETYRDLHVGYIWWEVNDLFVVWYGLDYNESYRELPYIGLLKEEMYK